MDTLPIVSCPPEPETVRLDPHQRHSSVSVKDSVIVSSFVRGFNHPGVLISHYLAVDKTAYRSYASKHDASCFDTCFSDSITPTYTA